jgi:hypothetical protein
MAHTSNRYTMMAYDIMIILIAGGQTNSTLKWEGGECGNDYFYPYPTATDTYSNH